MPLIYRAMFRDGDNPKIGPSAKTLGVRPGRDIPVDENGNVSANTGGMSVVPAWRNLPLFRIPTRLQDRCRKAVGDNRYACWKLGEGEFTSATVADGLTLKKDTAIHGFVEPAAVVSLETYQLALAATQDQWVIDED